MRLFVTVGNATVGFDRLLQVVEAALPSVPLEVEGVCQRGASKRTVPGLRSVDFLSREEFEKEMREADVVICHGGVGTIRSALSSGHRPLVMARRPSFGELVNDHQTELAEALRAEGLVAVISTADEVAREIQTARHRAPAGPHANEAIALINREVRKNDRPGSFAGALVLRLLALGRSAQKFKFSPDVR